MAVLTVNQIIDNIDSFVANYKKKLKKRSAECPEKKQSSST